MTCYIATGNLKWLFLLIHTVLTTPPQVESFTILHLHLKPQHSYPQSSLLPIAPTSAEFEGPLSPVPALLSKDTIPCATTPEQRDVRITLDLTKLIFDEKSAPIQQQLRDVADILGLVLLSFILSTVMIAWEDISCKFVLPNRHRTSISLYQTSAWGMNTIHGMGFGSQERQILIDAATESQNFENDPFLNALTYNEVMLTHRTVTIPEWKRTPTSPMVSNAIHTIIESIQQLDVLRDMANDYQWDNIRHQLYNVPFSDLSIQSSVLRQVTSEMNDVVGFDWGSCAWRHCGAISDIQEAIDEMDQLLGVLEPQEILFCLDIVERSLRDILSVVPWQQYALENDITYYNNMPPYVSSVNRIENTDDDSTLSRIDLEYFNALQELRID